MQHKNTHFLTHSLISHLSPLLLRPLLLLLRRKFSCLLSPSQKHQKKKKKKPAKTAKKKSQKIPKNSQKFSKSLSVTLPIFPKCSFPKQKLLFPAIRPLVLLPFVVVVVVVVFMCLSCLVPTLLVFVLCFLGENIVPIVPSRLNKLNAFAKN